MSETKHTPGPWVPVKSLNNNTTRVKAKNFGFIAEVIEFGKETDANAHLIAAAPELFEALELIVESHDENIRQCGEGFLTFTQIRNARLALAKARGES